MQMVVIVNCDGDELIRRMISKHIVLVIVVMMMSIVRR